MKAVGSRRLAWRLCLHFLCSPHGWQGFGLTDPELQQREGGRGVPVRAQGELLGPAHRHE